MKEKEITLILTILILLFGNCFSTERGCCSWHGGVSYCDLATGRIVCKDGTKSLSIICIEKNKKKD